MACTLTFATRLHTVSCRNSVEASFRLSSERSVRRRSMAGEIEPKDLRRAAEAIRNAKALIFASGAGMGVDSGLPDFRGPEGFWRAYPALRGRKIQLSSMSNPSWFTKDARFAWGFFGHRYNLYKQAYPHDGYQIILNWCRNMEDGYFAFTSNVDGHLQKAGYDEGRIVECHGSIHFLQCVDTSVSSEIWPVPTGTTFDVNNDLKLTNAMPVGPPGESHPARPNILMFGDWDWQSDRTELQQSRFSSFKDRSLKRGVPFVVIEIGAGLAVPTVRMQSEDLVEERSGGTLIRINPCEPEVPDGHISLKGTGLKTLQKMKEIYETL